MKKTGARRISAILSLIMLMVMMASSFTYAAGLQLDRMTPEDGEAGKQPAGMAIKMRFNEKMATEEVVKANEKRFKIKDPDGKDQPFIAVYDKEKYPNEIWLILEKDLLSDTEYTVTIPANIESVSGSTLGKEIKTTFHTRNVKTDSTISMVMTFVMMGLMIFMTSRSAKKMQEKQVEESGEFAMNPYKIAKEKGISVQEAVAYVEKERLKAEKAAKKKAKAEQVDDDDDDDETEENSQNLYRVKSRGSVVDKGLKVPKSMVKHQKQKREAARIAEEKRKANSAGKKKKK